MAIEFGVGSMFVYRIDADGEITQEDKVFSSFDEDAKILTLGAPLTVITNVGNSVIINVENTQLYTFGYVLSPTTIVLDEEADDLVFEGLTNENLRIMDGISAIYDGATVTQNFTGQSFRGNALFQRAFFVTDLESTATLTNVLFNPLVAEYINGMQRGDFGNGQGFAVIDDEYNQASQTKPQDVRVQIIKLRTKETDKYEEVILWRVKSDSLTLPTERDSFLTQTFDMTLQTKSQFDPRFTRLSFQE